MTPYERKEGIEARQSLVHVSRRWRNLVFQSLRRLNLQLFFTPQTARYKLNVWPAFPLVVKGRVTLSGVDNVVAALERTNRVSKVDLSGGWNQLAKVLAAMEVPFPELTDLRLSTILKNQASPPIPMNFLGESAPNLRILSLDNIFFTEWPKSLLSATKLVELHLYHLPYSTCLFPESMIASLSVMYSLKSLKLNFENCDFFRRSPSPPKRTTLPALVKFHFEGEIQYLEDFVIRIDTPQLIEMHTAFTLFFSEQSYYDLKCPRLVQFISRTPTFMKSDEAHVLLQNYTIAIALRYSTFKSTFGDLQIGFQCMGPVWDLWSIKVCNSLHLLSTVEDLYIENKFPRLHWKNPTIENDVLLELFLPFTAVKNLYLSKEFAPAIVAALQVLVGDRLREVLPSLQNILLSGLEPSGPFQKNIGQFLTARRLSNHPISISVRDENSYMK